VENKQKNRPAKVCHLTSGHPAFDGRIFYKEVKTLADEGYSVSLIAPHDKAEIIDGVKIVPLPKGRNRFQRMIGGQLGLLRLALKEKADIYHFHDPDIIPIGLVLKLFGKKVIYDVHELVYDSIGDIADTQWLKFGFLKKCVQFAYLLLEKVATKVFDNLILAEDGYENYYNKMHKHFRKYTIIRNYPIIPLLDNAHAKISMRNKKKVLIYAGGISSLKGIYEAIQSMDLVGDKAELWLLGRWENEAFRNRCEQLKGWQHTKYLGLLPLSKVYEYMKAADIGIAILYPIKNHLTSLPTKAYEYMFCGLAMVMSDFPLWKEVFGQCSLFVDPYDPKDIADKINYLLNNTEQAKNMGEIGKKLVAEKYNWEAESKKLLNIYEELCAV
jgi:glycosyltransferase involved in cell wall biosynthesis